jgi:hypothetical protein
VIEAHLTSTGTESLVSQTHASRTPTDEVCGVAGTLCKHPIWVRHDHLKLTAKGTRSCDCQWQHHACVCVCMCVCVCVYIYIYIYIVQL